MHKEEFYPNLIYENSVLECRVLDLPKIDKFPSSAEDEWQNHRFCGLRTADAYLLVYDITKPSTFRYLQHIRDQIAISRGLCDVPIVVAANKVDLVAEETVSEGSKMRHDISSKVKKAWKLNHIECSVKFNYNVTNVFRELASDMLTVRNRKAGVHSKFEKRKCCFVCI